MRSVRKTKLTLKNHRKTLGFLGVFLRKSRKSLKNASISNHSFFIKLPIFLIVLPQPLETTLIYLPLMSSHLLTLFLIYFLLLIICYSISCHISPRPTKIFAILLLANSVIHTYVISSLKHSSERNTT